MSALKSRFVCVIALALLATSCATTATRSPSASQRIVENYLAALNRRDLLALTAYVAPDFRWVSSINGDAIVEVESRNALTQTLSAYFERYDDTEWSLDNATTVGDVLAVTERFEWREAGAKQSRTTLGVYEFQDGRIRRVTYFLSDR